MNPTPMLIGKSETAPAFMLPAMGNRHGMVTGATGTGKTVTLQVLAEAFSDRGVPVVLLDVKGDLTGLAETGSPHPKIKERLDFIGIDGFAFQSYPVDVWDIFGEDGLPLRTTVFEMGPLLLGRLLDLTDAQQGILEILFQMADAEGLLLLDLKDLKAILHHAYENHSAISRTYGLVSRQSITAVQRKVSRLDLQGGNLFFGEPALNLADLLRTDPGGKGRIQLIAGHKLFETPMVYSAMLLWMISELYETLPEAGDSEKPRAVLFIDEAHILFDEAGKFLLQRMEQVVKLIRSKGIGLYFVTQNPKDIPEDIMSQLGNRIQHALRAYTAKERKALKAAADSFRENPAIDAMETIPQLGVGEALVSFLDEKGVPSPVDRVLVRPPQSRIGQASREVRDALLSAETSLERYRHPYDRESAYERLEARVPVPAEPKPVPRRKKEPDMARELFEAAAKTAVRSISGKMGRELARGLLGTFFKK